MAGVTINGGIANGGHSVFHVTPVVDADYVVGAEDETVAVTQLTAARTVTLPGAPATGRRVKVKDADGSATALKTITVSGNGHNIDGAAQSVIALAFGRLVVEYTGARWSVVG